MPDNEEEFIYHYTNIETLALILKNQTMRFTRLDKVDDLSEANAFGQVDFSRLLFVSCWTLEKKENIPQWHMYTNNMRGVRIKLPKNFFHYRKVDLHNPELGMVVEGPTPSMPIEKERIITDDYFIFPLSLMKRDYFEKVVEYKDDMDSVYEDFFEETVRIDGKNEIKFQRINELAKFKSDEWSFQQEIRYVLLIFPSLKMPPNGFKSDNYKQALGNLWYKAAKKGQGPKMLSLDLPIDPDILNNIAVRLGPMCTEGDKILIESLLQRFTQNGTLEESELTGKINI